MKSALRAAAVFVVVVAGWAAFRQFGNTIRFPFSDDWSEALLKLAFWVVPCVIALRFWGARTYGRVAAELGLTSAVVRGLGFALVASLPLLIALSVTGSFRQVPLSILAGAVIVGPFAEEVLFRGWMFRQLSSRAGWPVLAGAFMSALAFGLAHVHSVSSSFVESAEFYRVMSATAAGVLFAWLVWRWNSLWPAIGLHAFMNLSWQLFGSPPLTATLGASTDATTVATAGRLGTIVLAIVLTWVLTPKNQRGEPQPAPPSA